MNEVLRNRLEALPVRLEELNGLLAAENATRDLDKFRQLSREHSEVTTTLELYERYRQAERDAAAARADPRGRTCATQSSGWGCPGPSP